MSSNYLLALICSPCPFFQKEFRPRYRRRIARFYPEFSYSVACKHGTEELETDPVFTLFTLSTLFSLSLSLCSFFYTYLRVILYQRFFPHFSSFYLCVCSLFVCLSVPLSCSLSLSVSRSFSIYIICLPIWLSFFFCLYLRLSSDPSIYLSLNVDLLIDLFYLVK